MSENQIYKIIGKRIREEREKLGLTQEELADKVNMHPSFIGQLERGTKKASIVTIQRIVQAFNVQAGELFGEKRKQKDKFGEFQIKIAGLIGNFTKSEQQFLYETTKELGRRIKQLKKSILQKK